MTRPFNADSHVAAAGLRTGNGSIFDSLADDLEARRLAVVDVALVDVALVERLVAVLARCDEFATNGPDGIDLIALGEEVDSVLAAARAAGFGK